MKKKILWGLFLSILAMPAAHADYFDEMVTNTDLWANRIESIDMARFSFRSSQENIRYKNATFFVQSIKTEAAKRYRDGAISFYRMEDIIHDLDSLVYSLNNHFSYYKQYENTGRKEYKSASEEYFEEANQAYGKLKTSLLSSSR